MKISDLFEYIYRKKSPEEKAALAARPDAWRLRIRDDFKKLYKQFTVSPPNTAFYKHAPTVAANFGGDFTIESNEDEMLDVDTKYEMFLVELAKKLMSLQNDGHEVYFNHAAGEPEPEQSLDKWVARIKQVIGSSFRKHPLKNVRRFNLVWHVWRDLGKQQDVSEGCMEDIADHDMYDAAFKKARTES